MKKQEVQETMRHFEIGFKSKKGTACEKEELQAYFRALQTSMENYIKFKLRHSCARTRSTEYSLL